jgi:hypothetical protein
LPAPDGFFERFARHCPGEPAPDEILLITRSWDPEARNKFGSAIREASAVALAHFR